MQEWDASYDGIDVLKKALNEANSEEPLAQGRCTGFSGSINVIKVKKSCGDGECEHEHKHEHEHAEDKKGASKVERKAMDFVKLERESQS